MLFYDLLWLWEVSDGVGSQAALARRCGLEIRGLGVIFVALPVFS
jgi:hypothetical protein